MAADSFALAVADAPAITLPAPIADELEWAKAHAAEEKAPATREAYRSDLAQFTVWCNARGADPIPATPELIASYLAFLAKSGLKVSSISRKLAALTFAHKLAGYDRPATSAETVRSVMRGIRRSHNALPDRKSPATADTIVQMLKHCPDNPGGKRDAALLAFGFATACRRSELCAMHVEHLTWTDDGVRLRIPRSKTNQDRSRLEEIAIPRGLNIRPVLALETWLTAASISSGPVFMATNKWGSRITGPLAPRGVAAVVKKYATLIGADPAMSGRHSLRSGYVTACVEADAPLLKITEVTRHRSLDMLQVYSRRQNLFADHSGRTFL